MVTGIVRQKAKTLLQSDRELPSDGDLDVSALIRTMRNVTNSYKHLLLRAILKSAQKTEYGFVSYDELFYGMLEEAWWPAFHYRLSLGKSDKVVALLDSKIEDADELRVKPEDVPSLIRTIPFDRRRQRTTGLLRYVPQRLIVPWFEEDVKGTGKEDSLVPKLSVERFEAQKPLYRMQEDGITLHPDWLLHLQKWHSVFMGWSDAGWIAYLESRNPHALSLFAKIKPAFERTPLVAQRRIWAEACSKIRVECIYTGIQLDSAFFQLDHFYPHTFVGHDRFWNLTPTSPQINLDKRERLPESEFLAPLAAQHAKLHGVAARLSDGARRDLVRMREDYAIDLGIDGRDCEDSACLERAYRDSYRVLSGIAGRMGFSLNWRPTSW